MRIEEFGVIQEIENMNALGMCSQSSCTKPVTHYIMLGIGGTKYYMTLCKRHIDTFYEDEGYEKKL